jgi:hypothetical protein
MAQGLRNAMQ